jgi:hypothetical protein
MPHAQYPTCWECGDAARWRRKSLNLCDACKSEQIVFEQGQLFAAVPILGEALSVLQSAGLWDEDIHRAVQRLLDEPKARERTAADSSQLVDQFVPINLNDLVASPVNHR